MDKLTADDSSDKAGIQLEAPVKGEEIAVVTTNMGTFKLRFFPNEAPKTVYNFKKLAQNGYYDGLTFHRVIAGFMIQGGDPNGNGTGGESIWGKPFEDEFSEKVFNITGSVAMANSGVNTNGSQFFINNNPEIPNWEYISVIYDTYYKQSPKEVDAQGGTTDTSKLTDEIKALYEKSGGNIHLDGSLSTLKKGHTVFAQVFEGMDVVDKISQVNVDQSAMPTDAVTIDKVEIVAY